MIDITRAEFEDLVAEALDTIPEALTTLMDNVVVMVEDDAPEPGLLGLYEGVPLTERGDTYAGYLPDRITVFRRPLQAISRTRDDLVKEVRVTVVHEIAHHFGIDDERLHELGW
ncbi:metallopeptidase family protein [Actinoallomurus vinaceus]|uniref:Metallopeptidase family protein n=1 Tax=Actinoallomurus vinaceus TaxID=1080074 RepID=A0ABP8UFA8_9ACTN